MTETTRVGIIVCLWLITTALGILCWFLTGAVPVIGIAAYVVCIIVGAEYLRTRPR